MKTAVIIAMLVLAASMLFFGCTQTTNQVTNEKDASKAIADVGTDLSGVSQSLGEIDQALSDTNSGS
jgi:PBP1b-binding outer membrane lipoprotein LpoB